MRRDEYDEARHVQQSCRHPSLRCSLCHLFVDLVYAEQQAKIRALEAEIALMKPRAVELPQPCSSTSVPPPTPSPTT